MSIEKSVLISEYCDKNLTCQQIAKIYNIGTTTVKRLLKKYNIKPNTSKRNIKSKTILTEDFLVQKYIIENKTIKEISKEINISRLTISRALNRYNIPKRSGTRKNKLNNDVYKPKNDLTGCVFDDLTIIKYVKGGWLCKCLCGSTKIYPTKRLKFVKSCGCRLKRDGSKHHLYKGCGDISQTFYSSYYIGATDRNLEFDVSIEYLWDLYLKQNKKCALSKQSIVFKPKKFRTASLDRIDSSKGYIEGNVQWVHKIINQMKWDYNQDEFIQWCKLISENN